MTAAHRLDASMSSIGRQNGSKSRDAALAPVLLEKRA